MKTGDDESLSGAASSAIDPLGLGAAGFEVWRAMLGAPQAILETQSEFANAWLTLATRTMSRTAAPGTAPPSVVEPAPSDNRWKHPAWTQSPVFDALKQGYLLATQAVLEGIDRAPDVDDETKARVRFFAKQFCDAMSPTNFAMLNPAVIEETVKTGGANLSKGVVNALADLRENDGRPALVDKTAFTVGVNVAASAGDVVFRNELIEVIRYAPTTSKVRERPLLVVPPWINKFYILDLQPKNSLIKYATDHGMQTFVVSWRNVDASHGHFGFDEYLELGPLAAGRVVREMTGSSSVNQIGYCIGGTLTAMELAYLAKTDPSLVNAVTFFAAQVDFTESGELRNFLPPVGEDGEKKPDGYGVFPASNMADTFNLLRANDLIWNVAVNRYLLGKDAPAFDLLYWNSDATRMPGAMHDDYLRNMYGRNALAKGEYALKGAPLDLRAIRNDVYSVGSIEDHIAPWRSVYKMTQIFGGETRFVLGHSGHIAGIINAPSSGKGKYWTNDANPPTPDAWFSGSVEHAGSWWPDWIAWLAERSGEEIDAPTSLGTEAYPTLGPAPGSYVLEKA